MPKRLNIAWMYVVFILLSCSLAVLLHASRISTTKVEQLANLPSKNIPTVFELFTSQGCSSCPAADEYLGKLSLQANNITIACHVTYWNYLGWKDTFSKSFCDKRQRIYNNYLETKTNYTPQIIINGRYQGVGSRQQRITNMLYRASKDAPLKNIKVERQSKSLTIDISQLEDRRTMELVIMGLLEPQTVSIGRGENHGRSITYHNPVHHGFFKELESDTPNRITQNIQGHIKIKHWVVLAQDIKTGAIMAAGEFKSI